jgi:hypothetical protein
MSSLTVPAPFQEAEIISNKKDKDGHHYLKVLLLSNKLTRNNWIAPYEKISDLPKEVIDSFMNLPHINEHSYPFFIQLKDRLLSEGKSDDEIVKTLKEESKKLGTVDYIDHIFMDDPNSSLLYGQLKVMDPKENQYIEEHGHPSKNFTSPGVFGDAAELDDGTNVYDLKTLRAFHLASVDIPAFPEQEAQIKGVCKNGNSESCRKVLAVAGFNSTDYPATSVPTENVNNTCGCNKNIDMSTNNPQHITTSSSATDVPAVTTTFNTTPSGTATLTTGLIDGAKNSTQEAIDAARAEANKVIQENKKAEENKPQATEAELQLKKVNKELEEERNQKLEMKNFFLEKMLISAIPKENFKKEDEYIQLKESTKGLINKYGMSLEDADWLIAKVSKSVPALETPEPQENKNKKSVGVASWNFGTTYNSDNITKPTGVPKPASGSSSGIDEDDYPIPI